MKDLIKGYRGSLQVVRKLQLKADKRDRELLAEMVHDLNYAIKWMSTGRRPGNKRGAERLAAYQREKPIDPLYFQEYYAAETGNAGSITKSDQERIEAALNCLSKLEREIYLMARGRCISRNEIARMMRIEKGSVNKILARADKKILRHRTSCLPFATYI